MLIRGIDEVESDEMAPMARVVIAFHTSRPVVLTPIDCARVLFAAGTRFVEGASTDGDVATFVIRIMIRAAKTKRAWRRACRGICRVDGEEGRRPPPPLAE